MVQSYVKSNNDMDSSLDKALATVDLVQARHKQEVLFHCVGPNSQRIYKYLHSDVCRALLNANVTYLVQTYAVTVTSTLL